MSWLDHVPGPGASASPTLVAVRERAARFVSLLESNNRALEILGDMEEKAGGEYLFDAAYIRHSLQSLEVELEAIIDGLVALGGPQYAPLRGRFAAIRAEIAARMNGPAARRDRLTIPLEELRSDDAPSVGRKSAQLGEIKGRLGLVVPEGFAVSAWSYELFLTAGSLREEVEGRLRSLDIRCHGDLVRASADVQATILAASVPSEVAAAIEEAAARVEHARGRPVRFAMRSSAVGEDGSLSFAGQYATFLNVPAAGLVDTYRRVVASKFTPQAIYYLLSHSLFESDAPMAVCCLEMVEARSAGVLYTRDPVDPTDRCAVIQAVWGLGKLLVDGSATPDEYRVDPDDGALRERSVAVKEVRLRCRAAGGIESIEVPRPERTLPALEEAEAAALVRVGRRLEEHFGGPQDVEWAVDPEGRTVLLQSRPLRVVEAQLAPVPDLSGLAVLLEGGTTACPGAGAGPVVRVRTQADLASLPAGAVLVARDPVPGLVTVMDRASGIVTAVGGVASHLATLAREYGVPTLVGVEDAGTLEAGTEVTLDATARKVYAGVHPELVAARRAPPRGHDDDSAVALLGRVLDEVTPLHLLHPADPDFTPEHCRTYHDLTRFAHQKALESMFAAAPDGEAWCDVGLRLHSDVLLPMCVLCIDRELPGLGCDREIEVDALDSPPFAALWQGICEEARPTARAGLAGLVAAGLAITSTAADGGTSYHEHSFAILGREYVLCSLRMGYHCTTVEACASRDPARNVVRIEVKGGGAVSDRRFRRVQVLERVLRRIGFDARTRGDFLDARAEGEPASVVCQKLVALGRLVIMTKQLDMALGNDRVADWYGADLLRRLGLGGPR